MIVLMHETMFEFLEFPVSEHNTILYRCPNSAPSVNPVGVGLSYNNDVGYEHHPPPPRTFYIGVSFPGGCEQSLSCVRHST